MQHCHRIHKLPFALPALAAALLVCCALPALSMSPPSVLFTEMNPLLAGEQVLADQIQRHGVEIVIVDAFQRETPLKAQIGQTEHVQEGRGATATPATIARTTDFLIRAADYPEPVTRGHRIQFAGRTWQPSAPPGQPLERDSGRFGLIKRIHTVAIS